MKIIDLAISTLLLLATPCPAAELEPLYDRVQLNWDTMRIKFYGETSRQDSAKQSEEQAIKEGLAYIVEALPSIRLANLEGQYIGAEFSRRVAKKVSRQTYSSKTIYFSDGRVRVDLESSLPKALAP